MERTRLAACHRRRGQSHRPWRVHPHPRPLPCDRPQRRELIPPLDQPDHGFDYSGHIGPCMACALAAGIDDMPNRLFRLHQALREPVIGGIRSEEITGTDEETRVPSSAARFSRCSSSARISPFDVTGFRGAVVAQEQKGVGAEIVNRPRQQDHRAMRLSRCASALSRPAWHTAVDRRVGGASADRLRSQDGFRARCRRAGSPCWRIRISH